MDERPLDTFTQDLSLSRVKSARAFYNELVKEEVEARGEEKPLIGGMGWWLLFILTVFVDVLDVFFDLTVFLATLATIFNWILQAVIWLYYFKNGIGMVDKKIGKYIAIYLTTLVIETPPGTQIIPALSIMFVVVRILENMERKHHNNKVVRGIIRGLEYAESHHLGL